jgi:transposase-like protein
MVVYSREFKEAAVLRMQAGENISALSRELKVWRRVLYNWREAYRARGPAGLRKQGRPPRAAGPASESAAAAAEGTSAALKQARRRIGELERKVGQQQLELDFFRQALRQVRERRQPSAGSGVKSSTAKSGR